MKLYLIISTVFYKLIARPFTARSKLYKIKETKRKVPNVSFSQMVVPQFYINDKHDATHKTFSENDQAGKLI